MEIRMFEDRSTKTVCSEGYNYLFNKDTGDFARWGRTKNDDPEYAPFPEILDIEVTTKCKGPRGKLCPFCYKANTPNGMNMTFEQFKTIFDKMGKTLTQIAFGADAQAEANPYLFDMMYYCRENGVIPNITVADITKRTAQKLANVCGAVAVSRYADKNVCYDSIKLLTDCGMKQVNMHIMVSEETYDNVIETMNDYITDPRLVGLNAIVLLGLKQKGRGVSHNILSEVKFKTIINYSEVLKIPIGFDSCSAPKYAKAVREAPYYDQVKDMIESCESTLFSSYINEKGRFFPCSFTENWVEGGWEDGLNVLTCDDFIKDIWNHPKTVEFRKNLLKTKDCNDCRNCPAFKV